MKLNRMKVNLDATELREETLDGRTYLVAPLIMINVGVHNRALYTEKDLAKSVETWNDVPITVNHPEEDGKALSAKSPKVLAKQSIGRIFHSNFTDCKMKAEAWVDVEKTKELRPEIITRLNERKMIEVSTGHFSDDEQTEGTYNGETYGEICHNIVGNHLAFLPDDIGACSITDGAGCPRINKQEGQDTMKTLAARLKSLGNKMLAKADSMDGAKPTECPEDLKTNSMWDFVCRTLKVNEQSSNEVYNLLWAALYDIMSGTSPYVVDVYQDSGSFIYSRREENGDYTLWKRSYSVKDGKATLGDDAVMVVEKREYVPVVKANKEKGNEMETQVKTNVEGTPATVPAPAPVVEAPKGLTEADVDKIVEARVAKALAQAKIEETVTRIKANAQNKVPETALRVMSVDELLAYEKTLVPAGGDFSLLGAGATHTNAASTVPAMPKILSADETPAK